MKGFGAVGQVWDKVSFREHLASVDLSWASGVTMHHTAAPSLAQRPQGFKIQHIRNIESHYRNNLGWSTGPHLFVDEDQVFGMCPLSRRGIHAVSFNATRIGIEVLGDYDEEDPESGRGAQCWDMASSVAALILERAGWHSEVINGHRDDPRTSKSCPGDRVDMTKFRHTVAVEMATGAADRAGPDDFDRGQLTERIGNIRWQLDRMEQESGG